MEFNEFLLKNRKERKIRIVFDIETLQYNSLEGQEKPSKYKNVTYSVAIGYYNDFDLHVKIYPSFKHFFDEILKTFSKWKINPRIELIAHNTNKYDNHYLMYDLIHFYHPIVKNLFLRNSTIDGNVLTIKKTNLTKEDKKSFILEKRIKSSNNLELNFYLNGIEFYTTDNYMKTNTSIATLGEKLLKLNLIKEEDLKTDFDYTEFNKDYDMTDDEAYIYAEKVFHSLGDEHLTYIRNDIIILGESVMNYSKLFEGFDYEKITFTSNILAYYNDNDLTSYQLLKSIGQGKEKIHLKYTDYSFGGENFYDYLKSFFNGGLNSYNDKLVGKILNRKIFSIDLNSSYPYVMHNYKVPTFLKSYKEFTTPTKIATDLGDNFYLYRMEKQDFDEHVISKIKSKVLRKMLVKYYSKNDFININNVTIKMIKNITGIHIEEIPVLSFVEFETVYFGSRDKISEQYFIKTQGSSDKKIIYNSPYDIYITEEVNEEKFSQEETDISKVKLNGLYGIPSLRSHFNIFRRIHDELINIPNGYENNERNIVFSAFVTSIALYNLLEPLKFLSPSEIDKYFIYCDTDSLYLDKTIIHKIPKYFFHNLHLGSWGWERPTIDKMIVINHKKYAYQYFNEKEQKDEIVIKCGGIPLDSFNLEMSFEEFVNTQFCDGIEIKNQKSILNNQGVISIYPSITKLQIGKEYPEKSHSVMRDLIKEIIFEEIRNEDDNGNDLLYIETNIGTFSQSDIYPHEYPIKNKRNLYFLELFEREIRQKYL